jgi:hypothetical protein
MDTNNKRPPCLDPGPESKRSRKTTDTVPRSKRSKTSPETSLDTDILPVPKRIKTSSETSMDTDTELESEKSKPAHGLKCTFHGNVYQLFLLILFYQRGLKSKRPFDLSTEDSIQIIYFKSVSYTWYFLNWK